MRAGDRINLIAQKHYRKITYSSYSMHKIFPKYLNFENISKKWIAGPLYTIYSSILEKHDSNKISLCVFFCRAALFVEYLGNVKNNYLQKKKIKYNFLHLRFFKFKHFE